jgi:DNA repair protein RecO (recombination protein O)
LLRLLPERDPHDDLFEMADVIADNLSSLDIAPALLARFELALLGTLGFGLDLSACALTGAREDLAYVSPKSGRAVTRAAGAPWAGRLLDYPRFLQDHSLDAPNGAELAAAFRLTGHFLARDVFSPRGAPMPPARALYVGVAAPSAGVTSGEA